MLTPPRVTPADSRREALFFTDPVIEDTRDLTLVFTESVKQGALSCG
jgi:hypothetical protein